MVSRETIGTAEAALLLAVGPSSVKRWADEGVLACVRTAGGHRRFHRAEVERFAGARRDASASVDTLASELLAARDIHRVLGLLHLQRSELGAWSSVAQAVGSALAVLGTRWAAGEITVMAEHAASERLVRALGWLSASMPVAPTARRYLLVTAEGDEHTLGLCLAELCLRAEGWSGELVGRLPPTGELVARLREGGIDLLGLSASSASSNPRALAELYRVLRRVAEPAGVKLVLGGSGPWPDAPQYGWRVDDFDVFAALLRSPELAGG